MKRFLILVYHKKLKLTILLMRKSLENSSDKQMALDIEPDSDNISRAEVMSWLKRRQEEESKIDLDRTSKN